MMKEQREIRFDTDLKIEAYRFNGIMQKFPNHFHECYVIGFIEKGKRKLSCKNKEYIIHTNDLIIFNPYDNHTCEQVDDRPLDYRCLNVNPDIMEKVAWEITGKSYLPQFEPNVIPQCELVPLLREVHQMLMQEQKDFQKEELFLFLMEQLIEQYTVSSMDPAQTEVNDRLLQVCRYLEEHFAGRITLDDLCSLSGLNKYTLLRSFTRHYGITPYRYLETVRINEAKKLLEKGVTPIDAAFQTGFVDQSHFSNFFKEFIGLTPGQYQSIFLAEPES
ncbi:AraC family transcriptional regulator [Anaerolentibacter hominis]|uniref:AraC family transcriptional regulator n=1 Tax=Anaerolentibacter hominis TaxID=3079009 RepID=UPI0031B8514B